MLVQSGARITRYTHLFACVSEEESGFTIEVKLYNDGKPENTAKRSWTRLKQLLCWSPPLLLNFRSQQSASK